jgi:hypothetical protein
MPASSGTLVTCTELATCNPLCWYRDSVAERLSLRKQLAAQLEEVRIQTTDACCMQLSTLTARGHVYAVVTDGRFEGGTCGSSKSILAALLPVCLAVHAY